MKNARHSSIAVLGLAMLLGSSVASFAQLPKQTARTRCSCYCTYIGSDGKVHYSDSTYTFTTGGSDCSIGFQVGCDVGEHRGTYGSCTGSPINNAGAAALAPPPAGVAPPKATPPPQTPALGLRAAPQTGLQTK